MTRKVQVLFQSETDHLDFMDDHMLDFQKAQFLLSIGRHGEAAQIFLQEGETLQAIDALWKTNDTSHMDRARDMLLEELWWIFPIQRGCTHVEGEAVLLSRAHDMEPCHSFQPVGALLDILPGSNVT